MDTELFPCLELKCPVGLQWKCQKREFFMGTHCQQGLDFKSLNLRQLSEAACATQPGGLQDPLLPRAAQ